MSMMPTTTRNSISCPQPLLAIISDECSAAGNILEWDYPYHNGQTRYKPDITLKTNDDDFYVIELGITGERQGQIEGQYTRKDSKYHFIKPHITELCIIIIGYIGSNTLESLNQLSRRDLIPKTNKTSHATIYESRDKAQKHESDAGRDLDKV